jgi:hypothetical protein
MNAVALPDLILKDFASPLRIIKPESQNIGNPVINPVIPIAAALFFSPVLERMYLAILSVPPVLSRVIPIIAPKIIRNPIDPIVEPKPSFMVLIMVSAGNTASARNTETTKSAMKAWSFSEEVRKIIAIILIITNIEITGILMRLSKIYKF